MASGGSNNATKGLASRVTSISDEPKEKFASVQGYQNEPLVSIGEALKPLYSIMPWLENVMPRLRGYIKDLKHGITFDEAASIVLYTDPHKGDEGKSFYFILNDLLRNGSHQDLKPWFLYLRLFMTALSKIPLVGKRMIYRGVKRKEIKIPSKGETQIWAAFSSCTATIDVLGTEAFLGKKDPRILYLIECQSGRNIRDCSMITEEDEILLPINRHFQIISILDAGNDLTLVDMKEIDTNQVPSKVIKPTGPYQNTKLEQVITRAQPQSLVKLTGEMLNDEDMDIVVRQAINGKRCTELDLMANDIRLKGASIIGNGLCDNRSLEHLNISYNHIGDGGVRFIVQSINRSAVKILDLGETYMADEGAMSIAEILKTNRTLTRLLLNENEITDRGLTSLIRVLTEQNRTLKILDLSLNKYITRASLNGLVNMIKKNTSLTKVDIRRCGMTRSDEARIAEVFDERDDSDASDSEQF